IPWHFYFVTGDSTAPILTATTPANNTMDVELDATITITFSERMKTSTVTFADNSGKNLNWQAGVWSNNDKTVTYSHTTNFDANTWYNITVTAGTDMADNALAPGFIPNPFRFKTIGVHPTIVETTPVSDATNVAHNADIIVKFSKAMQTASVMYTCSPMPAGGFTATWSADNKNVTYSHTTDFNPNTPYTFEITAALDLDSLALIFGVVANPFNFTTLGNNPCIIETTPAHDDTGVALAADIVVRFDVPMGTSTVTYQCTPAVAGGFTAQWNIDNEIVTYSHTTDFAENTQYKFEITGGKDADFGLDLIADVIPNPWNFTTHGNIPVIEETSPTNSSINVPVDADIVITFSEAMDTGTIVLQCTPDPGGWGTPSWDPLNKVATFSHSVEFAKNSKYTC
ncbi:MAG: Ig-like domain-containing protein, partial [Thermoplasmata archaeon]|nr:Ig-like domain-containing protein [Thermoplasmata archaeon]